MKRSNGKQTSKTSKETKRHFDVDVFWLVAKSYNVVAKSRKEAEETVQKMVDDGEVCVWTDGFEATDETLVTVSGEEGKNGLIVYSMKPVSIVEG